MAAMLLTYKKAQYIEHNNDRQHNYTSTERKLYWEVWNFLPLLQNDVGNMLFLIWEEQAGGPKALTLIKNN